MLMLVFCRKPKRRRNSVGIALKYGRAVVKTAQRGFTLLEILVVLAMVGLMSALALPQLTTLRDRLEFSLNRESFERELSGLSYRAMMYGRPLVLSGEYPREPKTESPSPDAPDPFAESIPPAFLAPGQYRTLPPVMADDAPLTLPKGWRLTVENLVVYQVSGFCGGGSLSLAVGTQKYVYDLKSPQCRVELAR